MGLMGNEQKGFGKKLLWRVEVISHQMVVGNRGETG
jgi:hypothetical protein